VRKRLNDTAAIQARPYHNGYVEKGTMAGLGQVTIHKAVAEPGSCEPSKTGPGKGNLKTAMSCVKGE
jgi:hypothetical protein